MPADTLRERACAAPKSKETSPEIPKVLASWLKMCATSAFFNRDLDGIQPTLRQTPPQYCFSTTAVFRPSWDARIAATYPPGPPPSTTRSKCSATCTSLRTTCLYFTRESRFYLLRSATVVGMGTDTDTDMGNDFSFLSTDLVPDWLD